MVSWKSCFPSSARAGRGAFDRKALRSGGFGSKVLKDHGLQFLNPLRKFRFLSFVLMLANGLASGEPVTLKLEPHADLENEDYRDQIVDKFGALLKSDKALEARFSKFEAGPKKRAGGRYGGAEASSFVMRRSWAADFHESREDGGEYTFTQTVVVCYSFREGYRRGMDVTFGVFAIFDLSGRQIFKKGGDHEIQTHRVTAKFREFQTQLEAGNGNAKVVVEPKPKSAGKKLKR